MISVCIASYNGGNFIEAQIRSILEQVGIHDEVIVSDDGSTDNTRKLVSSIGDGRIRLIVNDGPHSPVHNFENALRHAKGDYIFLADQDDVWLPGRVSEALQALATPGVECTVCNRIVIDRDGNTDNVLVLKEDFTLLPFHRILAHNKYIGCCMAFSRRLLDTSLPFPPGLPMHDLWIGLLAHKEHKVRFIPRPLVAYRRHGNNVTTGKSPFSLAYRVGYRVRLYFQLIARLHKSPLR